MSRINITSKGGFRVHTWGGPTSLNKFFHFKKSDDGVAASEDLLLPFRHPFLANVSLEVHERVEYIALQHIP